MDPMLRSSIRLPSGRSWVDGDGDRGSILRTGLSNKPGVTRVRIHVDNSEPRLTAAHAAPRACFLTSKAATINIIEKWRPTKQIAEKGQLIVRRLSPLRPVLESSTGALWQSRLISVRSKGIWLGFCGNFKDSGQLLLSSELKTIHEFKDAANDSSPVALKTSHENFQLLQFKGSTRNPVRGLFLSGRLIQLGPSLR